MENCKDCAYMLNLNKDVSEIKENIKDTDKRVGEMEVWAGETKGQVKTIFNMLTKIEKSVDEINKSKNKFLTGIASGVAITVIATFLLQILKTFHW
ncbi:hypothetical protein [Clostridium kluyveri]|uniref:Uncharacterized protein n=1 Tax=Clostridium kluyveri TaxID=1534 RepID=A0A1L5F8P7_CLOKL|nr:hypothetical protein [Clostridium kluyveri]APM39385.1 hypothetical protein BS101_11855 [Clostridium kluyveri]